MIIEAFWFNMIAGVRIYRQLRKDQALQYIPVMMLSAVARKVFTRYLKMINTCMEKPRSGPDTWMEKPPGAKDLLMPAARPVG